MFVIVTSLSMAIHAQTKALHIFIEDDAIISGLQPFCEFEYFRLTVGIIVTQR